MTRRFDERSTPALIRSRASPKDPTPISVEEAGIRFASYLALACALSVEAFPPAFAGDHTGIMLSGNEIRNVWRFCSVSGRSTAAILQCFKEQTDKLADAKDIERKTREMEALTNKQVGVGEHP